MAKFTANVPLKMRLPGGFEIDGAVGATHRIPDALVEEFLRDQVPNVNGTITWITQDELSSFTAFGRPWYDPKAYGALGNNSQDDTTYLQQALTAAHPGGQVHIPPGTYNFSSTLSIPFTATVEGAGMGATILNWTGSTTGTLIQFTGYTTAERKLNLTLRDMSITASAASVAFDAKGLSNSRIERIAFSGAFTTILKVDGSYGTGIGAWRNHFADLTMTGGFGTGIYFTGTTSVGRPNENYVNGCLINGFTAYGIRVDGADAIRIRDNEISSSQAGSIGVYLGDKANTLGALVTGCRFEGNPFGVVDESAEAQVNHNLFTTIGTVAISATTVARGGRYMGNKFDLALHPPITDNSQCDTQFLSTLGKGLIPITFVISGAVATASGATINFMGITNNSLMFPGRRYMVRGLAWRGHQTISAGTITIAPVISGSAQTALQVTASSGNSGQAWTGLYNVRNDNTAGIGVQYWTTSDFSPVSTVYEVTLYLEAQEPE